MDFDQLEEEEYPQDDDLLLDDEYEDIPDDSGEYDDSDDWDNDFIPDEFKDGIMSSKLKDTLSAVAGMLLQPKGAVAGWAPVSAAGGLKLNTSLVEKKESSGKLVLAGTGSLSSSASSTSSSGKLVLSGVGKLSTTTSSSSSALNKGEKITVYNTRTGEKVTDTYYNILAGMVQNEVGDDKGTTGMELEMVKAQTVATACILTRGLAQAEKNGTVYQTAMKTPGSVTNQAVSQVGDLVMTAGGSVIDATYFAISSGYTNDSEDVWANKVSYLRSVESPYDQEVEGYEASVLVDEEDLAQAVEENLGITLEGNPLKWFAVKSRNQGNYVQLMSVGGQTWYRDEDGERQDITGYAFRSLVFDNQLRSTAFKMGYSSANGTFRFTTYGYGHGVGMSQVGANEMAKRGYTYDEILHHYYTGVSIVSR